MAITDLGTSSGVDRPDEFDPTELVSKKPSALPQIYAYIAAEEPAAPREIQAAVGVSKSVAHANLRRLHDLDLIDKAAHGLYRPARIAPDPRAVRALGAIRSTAQFELCRLATRQRDIDVAMIHEHTGMARSNVRQAARSLVDGGFLTERREPYENSPRRYTLSKQGEQALAELDVDKYRDWDGRETVGYKTGIDGTAFHTAYEIEDAHYLSQTLDAWIHPHTVAVELGKSVRKTQRRFSNMADRGLLRRRAEPEKLVFNPTRKSHAVFDALDLYAISRRFDNDCSVVAPDADLADPFTRDDLYAALIETESDLTVKEVRSVTGALKRARLIAGDPCTGYTSTMTAFSDATTTTNRR